MKILLDAQLPRSLVPLLQAEGCDTLHTLDLPDGNRSSDSSIRAPRKITNSQKSYGYKKAAQEAAGRNKAIPTPV